MARKPELPALPRILVAEAVRAALKEDLGWFGPEENNGYWNPANW